MGNGASSAGGQDRGALSKNATREVTNASAVSGTNASPAASGSSHTLTTTSSSRSAAAQARRLDAGEQRSASRVDDDGEDQDSFEAEDSSSGQPKRLGPVTALKTGYAALVAAIIRPPRAQYAEADLGPRFFSFRGRSFERLDLQLTNTAGVTLACSHWQPVAECRPCPQLPCVIYLHGNSSCRLGALEALETLLTLGVTVFALDTSGSGLSGGEWVTLGHNEKEDLAAVIAHLRSCGGTSTIACWGRSMGAATALLHSHRDPSIAALVLDSAFADLKQLALELVDMGTSQSGIRCVAESYFHN